MPPGADDGPTLHFRGFMDVNFAETDAPESPDGFALGQFVAHLSSSLGHKVSFFGEMSFTAHDNTFTTEVERAIIRYDYNDHFKISAGRYHTPINYWNTAFHHGQWLQTTISRPEMIQFGGRLLPVHFVGALLEGAVLHLLGTDADDDVAVDELGERGSSSEQCRSEVERLRAELYGEASAIGAQQPTLEEVHRR